MKDLIEKALHVITTLGKALPDARPEWGNECGLAASYLQSALLDAARLEDEKKPGPCGHAWDHSLHRACPRCAIEAVEGVLKGLRDPAPGYWRTGSRVPLNVYEGDRAVCQCHTAEDAERLVLAMNENLKAVALDRFTEALKARNEQLPRQRDGFVWEWQEWRHGDKGVPWRMHVSEFNALLGRGWEIVTVQNDFTLLRRRV